MISHIYWYCRTTFPLISGWMDRDAKFVKKFLRYVAAETIFRTTGSLFSIRASPISMGTLLWDSLWLPVEGRILHLQSRASIIGDIYRDLPSSPFLPE